MKILLYEVREDEKQYIVEFANKLNLNVIITNEVASIENCHMVEGCEGISILGQSKLNAELLDIYHSKNIKFISTRTIGYNHIDIDYAKKLGIRVCNARYAPNGVADFTVMMMLMCLRHYKQAIWRGQVNDFSLTGLQGKELKDLTIGVMGTGKIGAQVIRNLSGFGCKIIAYDVYENEDVKSMAEYVNQEEIFSQSDVITLHLPLLDSTKHIINRETIKKMKDGVIIINCARGELGDIEALVDGIESEKIGALGIDTVEGEEGIIHEDHRTDILKNKNWFYLRQFRNVIMTQHMAFYTDAAVKSMVENGILGIYEMYMNGTCSTEL